MIVLLDLDGTLVHTADESFKPMKDGKVDTDPDLIPPFDGAIEFVQKLIELGYKPYIVSDSVSKYVNPIVKKYFNVPSVSLAYKPNTKITEEFLISLGIDLKNREGVIVVGDTWLDIELGRAFGFKTILTQLYKLPPSETNQQDGIGKTWNHLKSGPTYVAKSFAQILEILAKPLEFLWGAEAQLIGVDSKNAIKLNDLNANGVYTIFRSLGRQDVGECDKYGIASSYTEFQREDRSIDKLKKLAVSVQVYMKAVFEAAPNMTWDYFSFVADKSTTVPPNKMKIFFELIEIGVQKAELFKWKDVVDGSIRNRPSYGERRAFISQNLSLASELNLQDKSIIIIDDQFTSGGTAYEIAHMLRQKGVRNVLFITLFFMTSTVMSNKMCSKCGKPMQIKIRKKDGAKFFSCVLPQYRGNGCGHSEDYI